MGRITLLVLIVLLVSTPLAASAHKLNPEFIKALTGEEITYPDEHAHEEDVVGDPRFADRTYYSFPEWYIVYSAQEYADFVAGGGRPSHFPYFGAIKQMWHSWELSEQFAQDKPDSTTNTILWTIAISFSVEYGVIGAYEKTVGRLTEWLHLNRKSAEDAYVDAQAAQYGVFLNQTPWYSFPYGAALGGLWRTYGWSSISPRGIERRLAFSVGYGAKAAYAGIIKAASNANFGGANLETRAHVLADEETLKNVVPNGAYASLDESNDAYEVVLPRYRAFLPYATALAESGVEFISIEGHDTITLSLVARADEECLQDEVAVIYRMPILTRPEYHRYVLESPVSELSGTLLRLRDCGLSIEHIYDY